MTEPLTEILRILETTADREQRMEIRTLLNRLVIEARNDGLEEAMDVALKSKHNRAHWQTKAGHLVRCIRGHIIASEIRALKRGQE